MTETPAPDAAGRSPYDMGPFDALEVAANASEAEEGDIYGALSVLAEAYRTASGTLVKVALALDERAADLDAARARVAKLEAKGQALLDVMDAEGLTDLPVAAVAEREVAEFRAALDAAPTPEN